MALVAYQHHTIDSTPIYDDAIGRWKCAVSITWAQIGSARGSRFLTTSPELFIRFEDAENAWIEAGKNWIESLASKFLRADT